MKVTTPVSTAVAEECLEQARQALKLLKNMIKKDSWLPEHPEYFHTEAYLEYQEFLVAFSRGGNAEVVREKLQNAKREIDSAIRLFPEGPGYTMLKEQIEERLSDMSSGRLSS